MMLVGAADIIDVVTRSQWRNQPQVFVGWSQTKLLAIRSLRKGQKDKQGNFPLVTLPNGKTKMEENEGRSYVAKKVFKKGIGVGLNFLIRIVFSINCALEEKRSCRTNEVFTFKKVLVTLFGQA